MSKKKFNDNGIAGLLQDLDNETLENIDIKNPMRVVRAWEVFHETGKSLKKMAKRDRACNITLK